MTANTSGIVQQVSGPLIEQKHNKRIGYLENSDGSGPWITVGDTDDPDAPPYESPWTGDIEFKRFFNWIVFRGGFDGGDDGTVVFILPVNFRTETDELMLLPLKQADGVGFVEVIAATGEVIWLGSFITGGGGTVAVLNVDSPNSSIDVGPTGAGPTINVDVDLGWLASHAVTSIDGTGGPLVGDVTFSAGTGISLVQTGNNIEIDNTGSVSALSVTDGTTTVTDVVEIDFTSGATVTDLGGGIAGVDVTGGGGTCGFEWFKDSEATYTAGSDTNLDWTTFASSGGDALLDLSAPTVPVWAADGEYLVVIGAELDGSSPGDGVIATLWIHSATAAYPDIGIPITLIATADTVNPAGAISTTVQAAAGDSIWLEVAVNFGPHDVGLILNALVSEVCGSGGGGGGGVTELIVGTEILTGAVTLEAGSGIELTVIGGDTIEISATGGTCDDGMENFTGGSLTANPGDTTFDWTTATQSGDTLLDLANPVFPVWLADGEYVFVVGVEVTGGGGAGDVLEVLVQASSTPAGTTVNAPVSLEITAAEANPRASVTIPVKAAAGDGIDVLVHNGSGDSITVQIESWVVQMGCGGGGGGGGSIDTITTDGGLTITNPSGPTVNIDPDLDFWISQGFIRYTTTAPTYAGAWLELATDTMDGAGYHVKINSDAPGTDDALIGFLLTAVDGTPSLKIDSATSGTGQARGIEANIHADGSGAARALDFQVTTLADDALGFDLTVDSSAGTGVAQGVLVTTVSGDNQSLGFSGLVNTLGAGDALGITITAQTTGAGNALAADLEAFTVDAGAEAISAQANASGDGDATGMELSAATSGLGSAIGATIQEQNTDGTGTAATILGLSAGTGATTGLIVQCAYTGGGSGTLVEVLILDSSNNPIFRIDDDGSVHIKTGTSILADL